MRVAPVVSALLLFLGMAACSEKKEAGEAHEARMEAEAPRLSVEDSSLLALARVSDDSARVVALAAVPGGRIVAGELEKEDGVLIYSYDIKVGSADGVEEVHVDAGSGKVIKAEHEDEESGEG